MVIDIKDIIFQYLQVSTFDVNDKENNANNEANAANDDVCDA